jgi:hypothetical protein
MKRAPLALLVAIAVGCVGGGDSGTDAGTVRDAGNPLDAEEAMRDGAMTTDDAGHDTDAGGMASDAGEDAGEMTSDAETRRADFLSVFRIFEARCGGCHLGATGTSGGLAMGTTPDSAYAALVGPDRTTGGTCRGPVERVTPGLPEESFLMTKIESRPPPGCGALMPIGSMLTPEQVETVRAWIAGGAPPP